MLQCAAAVNLALYIILMAAPRLQQFGDLRSQILIWQTDSLCTAHRGEREDLCFYARVYINTLAYSFKRERDCNTKHGRAVTKPLAQCRSASDWPVDRANGENSLKRETDTDSPSPRKHSTLKCIVRVNAAGAQLKSHSKHVECFFIFLWKRS